jgi:hypothetical protein
MQDEKEKYLCWCIFILFAWKYIIFYIEIKVYVYWYGKHIIMQECNYLYNKKLILF